MPPPPEDAAETVVLFVAVLFATALSDVLLLTVAVESCFPTAPAVAVMLIVADSVEATSPRLHVTRDAADAQVPRVVVALAFESPDAS